MLNYNEYTSCLDTRLYKSGREIGVTSHRRRDSQCGDDKVSPPSPPLPHPLLVPFHLIPNSAPQTSSTFPSSRIPTSSSSLRHHQLGIVFLDREPHAPHVWRSFCCTGEIKRCEIYSLLLVSGLVYSGSLCGIVAVNVARLA